MPTNNPVQLAAGPWEMAVAPTPSFYVSSFSGPRYQRPADGRADCWNEVLADILTNQNQQAAHLNHHRRVSQDDAGLLLAEKCDRNAYLSALAWAVALTVPEFQ